MEIGLTPISRCTFRCNLTVYLALGHPTFVPIAESPLFLGDQISFGKTEGFVPSLREGYIV